MTENAQLIRLTCVKYWYALNCRRHPITKIKYRKFYLSKRKVFEFNYLSQCREAEKLKALFEFADDKIFVPADMSSALAERRWSRQQVLHVQLKLRDYKVTIPMAQMVRRVQLMVTMV